MSIHLFPCHVFCFLFYFDSYLSCIQSIQFCILSVLLCLISPDCFPSPACPACVFKSSVFVCLFFCLFLLMFVYFVVSLFFQIKLLLSVKFLSWSPVLGSKPCLPHGSTWHQKLRLGPNLVYNRTMISSTGKKRNESSCCNGSVKVQTSSGPKFPHSNVTDW